MCAAVVTTKRATATSSVTTDMTNDKWQVVIHAGLTSERVVSEWASYDDAYCAMKEGYTDNEIEELDVDILKNLSTEC